jgi:hypothetical protein
MRDRKERQVSPPTPIGDVAAAFLQEADIPKSSKESIGGNGESVSRGKTSFSLSVDAKFKLATLKADLRRRGLRITESLIVERLIESANSDDLLGG